MAKKKKSLVDKVKEVFTKEDVVLSSIPEEDFEEFGPKEHSADFGIPPEDEELEELEDEE